MKVGDVEFVKELYPRLREDDAAIERYRAAVDKLPPITKYVVLQRDASGAWKEIGTPDAGSEQAAIRAVVNGDGGTFVATPARSFRPRTVSVERVEKVTFA